MISNGKENFVLRSSYHQKALQQIRNSIQPFATSTPPPLTPTPPPPPPSTNSSLSSSPRQSPNVLERPPERTKAIEYKAIQYPFVPSQVPQSVKKLLKKTDSPSSSPSPTNLTKKPTLLIKSTAVQKPVLQNALALVEEPPPPLPPKKPPLPKKKGDVLIQESPIPQRKKLTKEMEVERMESRRYSAYSPQAFKFFMEQHVENVIKSHKERLHRRMQLESEMAKIGLSEEAQTQMRRMLSQKESNYIRLKRAKMDKSMFKVIKTIGVGAFGEVSLVQKLDSQPRTLYAMKTLRKSDVLRRNQVAHVKAERDILAEADNEWVVKLYYSFQDLENLYFVMDYIPGGDLMSLLIKKGIFEEPLARFYIAELTLAVESVHKMGFIHRDIKPDNILIDRDGHIKLTDFGLCTGFRWTHNSKYYNNCENCVESCTCKGTIKPLERRNPRGPVDWGPRCLAHSLVGTPNYIAPEVLMRIGYTQLCDWWSVGVILYEMLVGQPPFLANTPAETQFKVINWKESLRLEGASLGREAMDLIRGLLTDHRGRMAGREIKNHPFFKDQLFNNLRRTTAPYMPMIAHPTDTSNFDPCESQERGDESLHNNEFHGFYEFTFRRFFDDCCEGGALGGGGPVYV